MKPVGDRIASNESPTDWLVLALRSFTERHFEDGKPKQPWTGSPRPKPSDWVLVFDCETKTTPDQKLRFGAYQLRYKGRLWERGVFYDPAGLEPDELETLKTFMLEERPTADGERIFLRTREAFVEEVFFRQAFDVGAQIVGLNLPYDISRLAIRHVNARGSMKGGFSLILTEDKRRPKVAIRHLSARTSLIRFTGAKRGSPTDAAGAETDQKSSPDRGYFVDLKTLAATITSGSHSLASLSKLLKVPTEKRPTEDHDAPLTPDYIRYGLTDVQATWECFAALAARVASFGLPGVQLSELYSEASLGKAYLKTMDIRPWREVQPAFPRALIGQIMSAYFGGRAEVHIRRQIVEVIHCDFLSMYPTVCTLMGLWDFVTAHGVTWSDATQDVRDLLQRITDDDLQAKAAWRDLATLVQVAPRRDVFPVRAHYGDAPSPNIGLNHLTSDEPLWFTLADVIASKVLTGRPPEILQAVRYAPGPRQEGLRAVTVAGKPLAPANEEADFYRDLIDHRSVVKTHLAQANSPDEKARLKAEEQSIKILANSTSYGIFMELNVEDRAKAGDMRAYGARAEPTAYSSVTIEKPGRYFHPLLGALITGAARLMLALAERQVIDQGLDWAFCDTDSIAIANTAGLSRAAFEDRALAVQAWFADLNPYSKPGPILKVEDVNFAKGEGSQMTPLYCLAISAKRYVLFNRDAKGEPVIRKASGHGLGHLMDPYDDPPEVTAEWIERVNAPRWQADVWREIIRATDAGRPDVVRLDHLQGFDAPARSRYGATTPEMLNWFGGHNRDRAYVDQVRPFNFLLSLQLRSDLDLAASDPDALIARGRANAPRPAAPFTKNPYGVAPFDRVNSEAIDPRHLKSLARSLSRYHLHSENKFLGGEDSETGVLQRRHVHAIAFQAIGKEADALEERLFLGEGEADVVHPLDNQSLGRVFDYAWKTQVGLGISDRELEIAARISHHTLSKLRRSGGSADDALRVVRAIERLRKERDARHIAAKATLATAHALMGKLGSVAALAGTMGMTRQYVGRILNGERPVSEEFTLRLSELHRELKVSAPADEIDAAQLLRP